MDLLLLCIYPGVGVVIMGIPKQTLNFWWITGKTLFKVFFFFFLNQIISPLARLKVLLVSHPNNS